MELCPDGAARGDGDQRPPLGLLFGRQAERDGWGRNDSDRAEAHVVRAMKVARQDPDYARFGSLEESKQAAARLRLHVPVVASGFLGGFQKRWVVHQKERPRGTGARKLLLQEGPLRRLLGQAGAQ